MVRTVSFCCRGHRFDPCSKNQDLLTLWHKKKKKERKKVQALARISGFCGFLTEHRLPSDTVQGYALVGATAKHPGREMGAECRWSI